MTGALTLTCCTSLVVSSRENLKRYSHSSQRFISYGSGADSVCELNEWHRLEGTSFATPLDDDGGRSHPNDATAVYVGSGRVDSGKNSELQAELAKSRQQAANELAALRHEVRAP